MILTRKETIETKDRFIFNRFIDYLMNFYGADGLYPLVGMNRTVARKATKDLIRIAKIKGEEILFDSYDREQVRDILTGKYACK